MSESVLGIPEPDSPPDFTLVMIAELADDEDGTLCVFVTKYHGTDVDEVCELALAELSEYLIAEGSDVLDVFVSAVFKGDCDAIFPDQDVEDIDLLAGK